MGDTEIVIRPAAPADAAAIARMANALGAETEEQGDAMTAAEVARAFLSGRFGLDVLVAEADGAVIGYALHMIGYETAYAAQGRYLSDLFVAPGWRRRGVGRRLIAAVAQAAADEGGAFIWWTAKAAAPDGMTLYRAIADIEAPITAFAVTGEAFRRLTGAAGQG